MSMRADDMKGKRRLLFLIPSLAGGGAERTLVNLLHKIDPGRYHVTVVTVLGKGPYMGQMPAHVELVVLFDNELLVRGLAYLQKKTGFEYLFRQQVRRKVRGHFDVGISFLDSNFTDLLFHIPDLGKRYTWVHSSYRSNNNFYRFYQNVAYRQKLIRNRYSRLDGIYFVSRDAMEEFIEVFGKFPVMEVVYNLVDRDMVLAKSSEAVEVDHGKFSFVSVGSLFKVKGYDRLIRAARILKDKGHDFRIRIFGRGMEEESLKALAASLGVTQEIEFKGFVSNPYPYMKAADVFVMSSVSEALPTVLCESMILGKPVVVTNCPGCRELVEYGKYGIMAEQDDADLAKGMETFLLDKAKLGQYAQLSLQRAEVFDTAAIMDKYYKIFNP